MSVTVKADPDLERKTKRRKKRNLIKVIKKITKKDQNQVDPRTKIKTKKRAKRAKKVISAILVQFQNPNLLVLAVTAKKDIKMRVNQLQRNIMIEEKKEEKTKISIKEKITAIPKIIMVNIIKVSIVFTLLN